MANYKRRSRSRDKRTLLPCGCCEDIRGGSKLPIEDGPCTGKKMGKQTRKPKEKCPVNGTHEWYTESETIRKHQDTGKSGYWKCDNCDFWSWQRRLCVEHLIRRFYTETVTTKTCIHCWTTKVKKSQPQWEDGKGKYPSRNLRLKKRPLSF